MLRITRTVADGTTTLKVEGRLVGEWVDELLRACQVARRGPGPLRLDLADVSFADADGLATLAALLREHVELAGCSLFLSALLHSRP